MGKVTIHPTAEVARDSEVGAGTVVWHQAQIRGGAQVGEGCIVGKGVYIDTGAVVGNRVKIQNYALIYGGVVVEDGVLVGPQVCLTNDRRPRAITPGGALKGADDWVRGETRVKSGAALGAHATVICGVTIGRWALVGAGSVVTQDVPDYGLVWGVPARLRGFVCPCGERAAPDPPVAVGGSREVRMKCPQCQTVFTVSAEDYQSASRRSQPVCRQAGNQLGR